MWLKRQLRGELYDSVREILFLTLSLAYAQGISCILNDTAIVAMEVCIVNPEDDFVEVAGQYNEYNAPIIFMLQVYTVW